MSVRIRTRGRRAPATAGGAIVVVRGSNALALTIASAYGAGCSSAAGPLVLTADTLPWTVATFRTTTTGIAAGSLCIDAIGLTQLAFPLDQLLAEGQPGCSLLSSLGILMLSLPDAGRVAHSSFALDDDPSLIGVSFSQQTIPLEFDPNGAIAAAGRTRCRW